jgi:DNA-binding PadR family transcriptional regulator
LGVSPVFGHGRLRLYLLHLLEESPRHGYELIRGLEERFLGLYAPSAGTVYPRLARLEAEGLVTRAEEEGRKIYRITEAGRAELASRRRELDDIEADIRGSVRDLGREIQEDVRGSVNGLRAQLKAAVREVREAAHERRRERESHHTVIAIEQLGRRFRNELRDLARRAAPTEEDVADLKRILDTAASEVRRVLSRI